MSIGFPLAKEAFVAVREVAPTVPEQDESTGASVALPTEE
jgi:hypothetical protein